MQTRGADGGSVVPHHISVQSVTQRPVDESNNLSNSFHKSVYFVEQTAAKLHGYFLAL